MGRVGLWLAGDVLRGWPQSRQVLGVECAQRVFNGLPDSDNTFLNIRTEEGDPKLSTINQVRSSRGRRAPRMGGTIQLHSFHCCEGWIIQKMLVPVESAGRLHSN